MQNGGIAISEQFQTAELNLQIVKQAITAWLTSQLNSPSQMMPAPNFRRRHLK